MKLLNLGKNFCDSDNLKLRQFKRFLRAISRKSVINRGSCKSTAGKSYNQPGVKNSNVLKIRTLNRSQKFECFEDSNLNRIFEIFKAFYSN